MVGRLHKVEYLLPALYAKAPRIARQVVELLSGRAGVHLHKAVKPEFSLADIVARKDGIVEQLRQAIAAGFDAITVTCVTDDKAHYYPGASTFMTKLIADKASHKLLGIQVLGGGAGLRGH